MKVLLLLLPFASARVDTSSWVGSAYTPAGAPGNSLWWHEFDKYEPAVRRELQMSAAWGVNTVRVFLHSLVFRNDSQALLRSMDRFLAIASSNNISAGFVFFDDCWNHAGASLDAPCVPHDGRHNGCWMASPQDAERTAGIAPFESYVHDTVGRFAKDPRVRWWEIFNEPRRQSNYSISLRDAGYKWAKAADPIQPIISCWDDNPDTEIVDHHDYGTAFSKTGTSAVYGNTAKGAVITEGGSRWYQPPYSSDQGSPLMVLHFLEALRNETAAKTRPYVPGIILCWTMFVGNDNTRWHWNTKDGSPEPAVPWDGLLFPDGTPVSYTEAAALRRYATGVDEFLSFSDFLAPGVVDADTYLTLTPGTPWQAPTAVSSSSPTVVAAEEIASGAGAATPTPMPTPTPTPTPKLMAAGGGILAEASFWPTTAATDFRMTVGSVVDARIANNKLTLSSVAAAGSVAGGGKVLGTFDLSTLANNGCLPGAWNILRVVVSAQSQTASVWFNPVYGETGFVGDASDATRIPRPLPPRIHAQLPRGASLGAAADAAPVTLRSSTEGTRVDYVSVLPASALQQ